MSASSDEGEIVENGVNDLKATSPRATGESGIDRRDRNRSRHSSVDLDNASRHSGSSRRSRSPRGYKRSREERDSYGRARDDVRGSRRYDDAPRDQYQRSRLSYEDLDRDEDRHTSRDSYSNGRRDRDSRNGDRYADKRPRHRSRSPYDSRRNGGRDRFVREGHYERREDPDRLPYDDHGSREVKRSGEPARTSKVETKTEKSAAPNGRNRAEQRKPEPEPEVDYVEPEPIDEEAEIERRRKRRAEIMAKSSSATPLLLHAVGAGEKARAASPALAIDSPSMMSVDSPRTPTSNLASPRSPGSQDEPSPGVDLTNLMNTHSNGHADDDDDGPSAADYDPTIDMQEDERRDEIRHGQVVLHGEAHAVKTVEEVEPVEPPKKASEEDDDFDMFADDFDEDTYATKQEAVVPIEGDEAPNMAGILEGDDKDGYYKLRIGEVLNGRYHVQATLGRGMFSSVVRALDMTTKKSIAIKIMRNNDALRKGGYTEIAILEKLNAADPENRKHIIKFERSFDYRGHLCMAFENLSLNLREVLRKFGNNVGINLSATRAYAYQMFVALAHMRKCDIIHADLKPDNILVNESRNVLKICDLGTAVDRSDAATAHMGITPYLVSRFYRAPEIILGMPYDAGVDMWSIGCTLYELYTGKILFTGDSNNQMLKAIMDIRGKLTTKLFKRGQLSAQHFDEMGNFVSVERDKVLGKTTVRTLAMLKPTRDLRTRLMAASKGMNEAETRDLGLFLDLLEHCLALNPDKRMKPADALRHPFFARPSSAKR